MAALDLMKVTVGTGTSAQTYFFRSRAETYANIGSTVGVTEASDTEEDNPAYKVEELQGSGILFRLSCRLENGKRRQVLCARDLLVTALDTLESQTIDGSEVESVAVARRARFR